MPRGELPYQAGEGRETSLFPEINQAPLDADPGSGFSANLAKGSSGRQRKSRAWWNWALSDNQRIYLDAIEKLQKVT
jgi:hypothetical protein